MSETDRAETDPEPISGPELVDLRTRFESMISELLLRERTDAAYALADLAVAEGLWPSRWQRPVHLYPATAHPTFLDQDRMWFVAHLESHWEAMRAEIDRVVRPEDEGFSSAGMDGMSVLGTGWRQLMLWDRGTRFDDACRRFPTIAEVVEGIPEATTGGAGFVMLSWLHPGTWLAPHCGPSNAKARTHLALRAAEGAMIRIGPTERSWTDGKAFTFDDSFEHEVWHDGSTPRIVLILDTPNPMLRDPDGVARAQRAARHDEVRSFMAAAGLARVDRRRDGVEVEFDPAMIEFMRSYLETREIESAELADGTLTVR